MLLWVRAGVSYVHNLLEANATLKFSGDFNNTNARESTSYTSLVKTSNASGKPIYVPPVVYLCVRAANINISDFAQSMLTNISDYTHIYFTQGSVVPRHISPYACNCTCFGK